MSESPKCVIAQFRTCLWPCVGRWASGQEAGQPPKEEPASLHPRPAAGGEPAHPALHGGRGLKRRRNGLFWLRPSVVGHRRGLSFLAGRADRDLPFRTKSAHRVGTAGARWPCRSINPKLTQRRPPPPGLQKHPTPSSTPTLSKHTHKRGP